MRLSLLLLGPPRIIKSRYSLPPVPKGKFSSMILNSLEKHCSPEVTPDTPAIIDGLSGKMITRGQLRNQILVASKWFENHIKPGEVVGVSLPNVPAYLVPVLAALEADGAVALLNPVYTAHEARHTMSNTNPRTVVTSPISLPALLAANREMEKPVDRFIVAGEIPGDGLSDSERQAMVPFQQLFAGAAGSGADSRAATAVKGSDVEDKVVLMPFSSGTTGLPKAVCLTNKNCTNYHTMTQTDMFTDIVPGCNMLSLLPMFHMYGFTMALTCLLKGAAMTTLPRFTLESLLQSVQEYKVTHVPVVPPIAAVLAEHPLVDQYDLSSVKSVLCAAAPLSVNLQNRLAHRLKVDAIRNGYGLTESVAAVAAPHPNCSVDLMIKGSVGELLPGIEARVVDVVSGEDVEGPGCPGELLFRGPTMMSGYLGNPGATAATLSEDGWLYSGDIGMYDKEEYFYITDRLKELIKYKAWQIAPAELEAILIAMDGIADVGVVGVPTDEEGAGEVPKAFVVASKHQDSGIELTAEKVQDYLKERVSSYKELRGGVVFIDAIPRSLAGKILRRELRKM